MSVKEIIYRFKNAINKKYYKWKYKENVKVTDLFKDKINLEIIDENLKFIFTGIHNLEEVEIKKNYNLFEEKNDIFSSIDWHAGTKGTWNKYKYSLDIDTKFTDEIGDIRYSWEINRHQIFPYLALLYRQTDNKVYYNILKKHFYHWNSENYFLKGINWLSPMEIAIRNYQWLITYYLLGDIDKEFRSDLIKGIIVSTNYVSKNLSRYSSANNHLILEAVMISIIGYCLEGVYNQEWFQQGYNILENEIPLQFNNDGVNKEQALHYQAFVIDAILQYNFILRRIGKKAISENTIYNSLKFIGSLKAHELNFDYGDSDDAKILSFTCGKQNYYKHILELGSIYYKEKFFEFTTISNEVKFISGYNKLEKLRKVKYEKAKLYRDGGYLVINNNNANLLMDVGELGLGSIAAHGHSDALAFIYYNRNNPIIIDSGTYIYNVEDEFRNYFRSTEAHNTLCYRKLNQSEIKGPFLWGKKANVKIINYILEDDYLKIEASHDGYNPLIHRRELFYYFENNKIIIRDYFDDVAEVNFILDNKVELDKISDNVVKITSNNSKLLFKSNSTLKVEDTVISKGFMSKIKSKKIVINKDFKGNKYLEVIIEEYN